MSPCTCPSPTPAGTLVVRHAHGSLARADDFRPIEDHVAKGLSNELASSSGDSSSGDSLPFFNVQLGTGGVVEAIGWTGNWKARFTSAADGKTATLTADMQRTHLVLHPGEEIRTPRIVLMPWNGSETTATETGTNWQDAQNTWRRLLLAHYSPRQNGKSMPGPILFGSWSSEPIANKLSYIDWVHQHRIPVTLYAVDAGWYGASVGAESDPTNPWWQNRGDWFPSPTYYPAGLQPLGDSLRAAGLGFSLTSICDKTTKSHQFYLFEALGKNSLPHRAHQPLRRLHPQPRQKAAQTPLRLHPQADSVSRLNPNGPFCTESLPYPKTERSI